MPDTAVDDELDNRDLMPYLMARRQLRPSVPTAAINPSGASYGQGYSPDDPGDQYANSSSDPAAFNVSAGGSTGIGATAQPQAPMDSGNISAGAGKVLNGAGTKMMPPGSDVTPTPYSPQPPPGTDQTQIANAAVQRMQNRTPPLPIGDRPQDIDPATGKEKLGAKAASWGQRLALAVLAATKLAPYAQQIVRPEYTQQMGAYQAANTQDAATAKAAEGAATTEYTQELKNEQADLAKAKADPHYGRVRVDPAYAKENMPWLIPDAQGQYWVDKQAENTLTKPAPAEKFTVVPAGAAAVDPATGQPIFTNAPKPEAIKEGEMSLGERVPQLNQMLASRYQILHPGQPLPPQYTVPAQAVQKDYDRIDKGLEAEERAQGNQTQLAIANEMRKATQGIAQSNNDFNHASILTKPHEKAFDDANTQLEKINDAQMMVKGGAIDQAIGVPKVMTALVTGAGSGVRVTRAELNAIGHARGIAGDVEGTIRSWLGQGKLAPEQQSALNDVLENVKKRVIQKRGIANDAILGIRGAGSTSDMISADNAARKKIMDLEAVQQSTGKQYQQMKTDQNGRKWGWSPGMAQWEQIQQH